MLSVCSVQYKCVTDAQKRKTMLPGRGLEYIDRSGKKHQVLTNTTKLLTKVLHISRCAESSG